MALERHRLRLRACLDDAVRDMVIDMSRRYGWTWAYEPGFRAELERRTGRRVGARSIARVLRRLAARGEIEHRRIPPGGRLPNGARTGCGGQKNRHVPRWKARKAKKRAVRDRERARVIAEQLAERERAAERKRLAGEQPREPSEQPAKLSLDKQQELQRLISAGDFEQLSLFWRDVEASRKPPD
jgi:hypothetical protein